MVCPSVLTVVVFLWPTGRSEPVEPGAIDLCLVSYWLTGLSVSTDDSTSAQKHAASVGAVHESLREACARAVRFA
jgi:hypothetical protein